jgi:hypothetical protein
MRHAAFSYHRFFGRCGGLAPGVGRYRPFQVRDVVGVMAITERGNRYVIFKSDMERRAQRVA